MNACFVGQGFKDKLKPFTIHNSPALRQSSTKLAISTAAIRGFQAAHLEVKQAYLQSKDNLECEIYLNPCKDDLPLFSPAENEVLRLQKPLYGICDASDYWNATFSDHRRRRLHTIPLAGDLSLHIKQGLVDSNGLLGTYVDDCL